MPGEYSQIEMTLDAETEARIKVEAEEMGLPENGVLLMTILEMGIQKGTVDPNNLMSAQEHMLAMADRIEANGVRDEDVFDIVAKLRILSSYATTQLVPVDPY